MGRKNYVRLTFVANACCWYEYDGFKLLADPWIIDGAFEGSWCHALPLNTKPTDLVRADALYISHIHPDHLDPASLVELDRSIPIVILRHGTDFLAAALRRLGFRNVTAVDDRQSTVLGPFNCRLFGPFTGHVFHDTELGNMLDSALLLSAPDGTSVLNTNDNTPTAASARRLVEEFGSPTLSQLNYNAAGPYPSCFINLTHEQKHAEHRRILDRNLSHMVEVAGVLGSRLVMPFAGAYVLAGPFSWKNEFLGTTTQDEAGVALAKAGFSPVLLEEGGWVDVGSGDVGQSSASTVDRLLYAEKVLSHVEYPYFSDPWPDMDELIKDVVWAATGTMRSKQRKLDSWPEWSVDVVAGRGELRRRACVGMSRDIVPCVVSQSAPTNLDKTLTAYVDPRLLRRILDRRAHWNSAEIGCHIEFSRHPNEYCPDVHTLLSFLHL